MSTKYDVTVRQGWWVQGYGLYKRFRHHSSLSFPSIPGKGWCQSPYSEGRTGRTSNVPVEWDPVGLEGRIHCLGSQIRQTGTPEMW